MINRRTNVRGAIVVNVALPLESVTNKRCIWMDGASKPPLRVSGVYRCDEQGDGLTFSRIIDKSDRNSQHYTFSMLSMFRLDAYLPH